jgi:N-methylhydantoinase A
VYPGQTFDAAIAVPDPTDVEGAVEEFHRINAEARLIEARAQEPMVRGMRLTAVGEVDRPSDPGLAAATSIHPIGHRRMWVGGDWHDAVPLYDIADVGPGITLTGPAAINSPFTTIILAPGERARPTPGGDILIEFTESGSAAAAGQLGRVDALP